MVTEDFPNTVSGYHSRLNSMICVSPVYFQVCPAGLQELSTLQFLVFLTAKKSCSDHLGFSYRAQSQRWELGLDPTHWDQKEGCFWASGHDELHRERRVKSELNCTVNWKEGKDLETLSWTFMCICISDQCWVSGGVRGHTWSAPAGLLDSAQESMLDPPHTAKNTSN